MRKSVNITIVILTVFSLLLISVQASIYVNAQPPITLPVITISSDGSIQSGLSPQPITNKGTVYTINENVSGYGLDIKCNNILLLGKGNTLQATALYNTNSGITIEATGVTVENVSIAGFYVGIDIRALSDEITGCNITAYDNGINVYGYYNLITGNQILECGGSGIELSTSHSNVTSNTINCPLTVDESSSYDIISGNLLNSGDIGIYGDSNNITGNIITGGGQGIIFYDPANANTVSKNDIINNFEGIGLDKEANYFYLNNLINNTYDVRLHIFSDPYVPYSKNVFDNGSVGNYWSDYKAKYPNAIEIGHTGIYNTSYVIVGNITDNYPLMAQYNIGMTGIPISVPTPTPSVPEFSWLAMLTLFLFMLSVTMILRHRKNINLNQ